MKQLSRLILAFALGAIVAHAGYNALTEALAVPTRPDPTLICEHYRVVGRACPMGVGV